MISDRIRLRLINSATATFFRVALDGHELQLIAADGRPVEPLTLNDLLIATAERYDVLVSVRESGSFTLHAAALGTNQQVVGVIHTADATPRANVNRVHISPIHAQRAKSSQSCKSGSKSVW